MAPKKLKHVAIGEGLRLIPKAAEVETAEHAEGITEAGGIPPIESRLRHNILRLPEEIKKASGIVIYGRKIRSLLYTTDIALIRNNDADAIFCVYPFTASRAISAAVIHAASTPVFCGVGGGTTQGVRSVYLATDAENQGAMGVVLNAPMPNRDVRSIARVIDIPIVVTVVSEKTDVGKRVSNGAAIINVAAGAQTPELVKKIRASFPRLPIMASGGKTADSIKATIKAGANAIVYTPPTSHELFAKIMDTYRER
ncbi:MAG: dioxygenase [Eggerthellaceae bacterium]|nr:dioxygenase [Eggerthellaceae bacterium]